MHNDPLNVYGRIFRLDTANGNWMKGRLSSMNNKVLLVDNDVYNLASFERNFRLKYKVVTAQSGEDGLIKIEEDGPFAAIIADYDMPCKNDVPFLLLANKMAPDSTRIMFSGMSDTKVLIDAINDGHIFYFLNKPCPTERLEQILVSAVERYCLLTLEKEMLEQTLKGSIKLLIDILSLVNNQIFTQATRLRKTAQKIAMRLMSNNLWEIEMAALFSQIGCVTIPSEILNKVNSGQTLTQGEMDIYFSHPHAGKTLLRNIPRMEEIANSIAYQFKQFDGNGYPHDEKKGKSIPFIGRIIKVVFDYDTLLALGESPANALAEMRRRDTWYDTAILAALDAEINSVQPGFVVIALKREEITIGMVLADDIRDNSGAILIPKGYEITNVLQMRLIVYARLGRVMEPIKVLKQI